MDDIGTAFTFGTLANHDEAFRISLLVLINDPGYRMLPMRQAMTIYRSICSRNYFLMLRGSRAVGVIMWMEVSAEVENDCLSKDRSPFVDELSERSHALYCMAIAATEPGAMLPLWRHFARNHAHRDILIKRHFQGGKPKVKPISLIRDQKKVRLAYPLPRANLGSASSEILATSDKHKALFVVPPGPVGTR